MKHLSITKCSAASVLFTAMGTMYSSDWEKRFYSIGVFCVKRKKETGGGVVGLVVFVLLLLLLGGGGAGPLWAFSPCLPVYRSIYLTKNTHKILLCYKTGSPNPKTNPTTST